MIPIDRLVTISYADSGAAADTFQRSRSLPRPFEEVLWRLREAIEAADLRILHEVDPQMQLRRGGYTIGAARQILFFHPRFVVRILEADHAALLEAPLKLVILELPAGSTSVRWIDPLSAFSRYENAALSDIGRELTAICEEIVAAGFTSNGTQSP
jgi:uncharacterized protein (DUF302 family)